jgi:hypothetical protein
MAKKDNYIMYNGERLDLSEWVIPSILAKEFTGNSDGYVRKLKWKKKHDKPGATIDFREIPELKLTLLKK